MLQRGRKSQAYPDFLSSVKAPLPEPIYHLDSIERKLWDQIVSEHDFNHAGLILLNNALKSLGRCRHVSAILDKDGPVVTGRRNHLKQHPLLGTERALRSFCYQMFKKLKIDPRRAGVDPELQ